MGRIIKGRKDASPAPPQRPQPIAKAIEGGRLIERDVYKAQQIASEILKEGEKARKKALSDGQKEATRQKEQASAKGATEAFNQAGQEALQIFLRRGKNFQDLGKEVRILAEAIAVKILGTPLGLTDAEIEEVVAKGINRIRGKRRLVMQFPIGRLDELQREDPDVFEAIKAQPDIDMQEVADVESGYMRVLTDAGNALCAQKAALDTFRAS